MSSRDQVLLCEIEAAYLAGLKRARDLAPSSRRRIGFPEPVRHVPGLGWLWNRRDIEAWAGHATGIGSQHTAAEAEATVLRVLASNPSG